MPRRWWCEAGVINRCPPNIYKENNSEIHHEISCEIEHEITIFNVKTKGKFVVNLGAVMIKLVV